MRRFLVVCLAALACAAPAATAPSWAAQQIAVVVKAGLMGTPGQSFRPQAPLTRAQLERALAGIEDRPAATPADPAAPVTIRELDAALVGALGLRDGARALASALAAGGLAPPRFAGTESMARLLGLRLNHPAEQDGLELLATDPATRAEAAFSIARALELGDYQLGWARSVATSFAVPELRDWQRRILRRAVALIGYPYVWGGTSEDEQAPFGVHAVGGFDCSGLVWRVYKTKPFPDAPQLADVITGRTTMEMAREAKRPQRIPFAQLEPADVLFFGARGPRSKPREIDHAAIYLGDGWLVQSSGQGVALATLDGWYRDTFAFGFRPLREAGLTS